MSMPHRVVTCLLLLLFSTISAQADERILRYHSDITVSVDGSMSVTETIKVRAEGKNIRRGIYRDFPTDYKDQLGNRVQMAFELVDLLRDGQAEPHHTERRANGVRVYAGSANVLLEPGEYEYSLTYRTSRMLGFFKNHDELYWNVTGNGWAFPIDVASATVTLPDTVTGDMLSVEGYTGASGSKAQNYHAEINFNGQAMINTTVPLAPREGLTLVVSWPKGHVDQPDFSDNAAFLLRQNIGLLIALASGVASLCYLFMAWRKVGRDPPPGVIFPHYEPPVGFSPASMRYISRMGYDKRALTAAVLNLAVKGFVTVENLDDDYALRRTSKAADKTLAPGEEVLLTKLFKKGHKVELDDKNHSLISAGSSAHEAALKRDYKLRYFVTNGVLLLPAIFLLLGALAAIVLIGSLSPAIIITLVASAFALPLFAWLLKAPTLIGRKLLDKVEGFKMYLEVAEKEDLDLRNPPDKTPELFETYLPYALALGVEQRWAEQFEEVFRRISSEQGGHYQPRWYGGNWDATNPVKMTKAVGASFNSAISSASTPPGSSSGGGGGGSSGGGGGGGGGGGW